MNRILLLVAASLVSIGVAIASAAQVGSEGQVASFEARLSPPSLPRSHRVPIQIRAEGEFLASQENHLAQLISLEIGINRHGLLVTDGLAICHMRQLIANTTHGALDACKPALIGHGAIRTTTEFPEQGRSHFKAPILLFNGRQPDGGARLFLFVHGSAPGPFTVVIPIEVRRTQGTFGTTFFARMPGFARRWAYLTKFRFVVGRKYRHEGKSIGVIQASCPAPKGLNGAIFPFARATYHFLTTKTLRTTLVGGCHVRRE